MPIQDTEIAFPRDYGPPPQNIAVRTVTVIVGLGVNSCCRQCYFDELIYATSCIDMQYNIDTGKVPTTICSGFDISDSRRVKSEVVRTCKPFSLFVGRGCTDLFNQTRWRFCIHEHPLRLVSGKCNLNPHELYKQYGHKSSPAIPRAALGKMLMLRLLFEFGVLRPCGRAVRTFAASGRRILPAAV